MSSYSLYLRVFHVRHKHVQASKTNSDCRIKLPILIVSCVCAEYYVFSVFIFDCFNANKTRLTTAAVLAGP